MTKLKSPKPGAVAEMRELYNKLRKQPLTPEQKNDLREVFKKRDRRKDEKKPKKIAKPLRNAELP